MTKKIPIREYVIDAAGQALGRVATQAALRLRGKDQTDFAPHLAPTVTVKVINAGRIKVTPKKLQEKLYRHYTGHPGGLRETTMARLLEKKGWDEVIRKAVYGMLPANRLRAVMMTKLTITE
ncbi:MAG: 50S ribosomal protein L13 [Candidatus Vogelbacteria bacterium CG10_big_fil_rev_8_21_14_0_10_49_38]|uniref:Large ribosomal subunit protein uL13 n=1 Tax=Candidatus Vogelbacteria bacterium CG10_big_fil_rev_8_21_14_0_10_49_38 TaxID=1975043 RepID=A0A2H0RH90_9BACT|nr:MAG: 50S ribosomal protein L13 [bacterium CG10_49_38]PIR45863.1 MAG: 50S ribosomal protein L13 [Candidatus Vogelbacteria bacterium CG10_big_fil_rev_8_21_14_0_10_49_38]